MQTGLCSHIVCLPQYTRTHVPEDDFGPDLHELYFGTTSDAAKRTKAQCCRRDCMKLEEDTRIRGFLSEMRQQLAVTEPAVKNLRLFTMIRDMVCLQEEPPVHWLWLESESGSGSGPLTICVHSSMPKKVAPNGQFMQRVALAPPKHTPHMGHTC